MKIKDIREKTDAELGSLLEDLRREKLNLKIQSRTGQLENTARAKEVRKDIARIKTELVVRTAANS